MAAIHGKNYGKPTLDLNFAGNKSLVDTTTEKNYVTFSRAQSANEATYIGSDGLIKYAAADEARFDHDPVTGECLGLLVEEARTNSQPYSNNFSTNWSLNQNGTAYVTPNAALGPSGLIDAFLLINANGAYIEGPAFILGNNIGFGMSATYNLSTQSVTTSGSVVSASISDAGNGWYRCIFMPNTSIKYAQTVYAKAGPSTSLTIEHYVENIRLSASGGLSGGVYIWGCQSEAGTFPTSYIPTTSSAVTRSQDIAQITGDNFSSWYNQSEGSFVLHENKSFGTGLNTRFEINQNSSPNFNAISFAVNYGNGTRVSSRDSNSAGTLDRTLPNVWTQGGSHRYGYGLQLNNSVVVSGSSIATDNACTLPPNLDSLSFGANARAASLANPVGKFIISRLTYYPKRLPDIELQQLTK